MLECQMVKSSNISIYLKSRILSYILCIIFYCFYYTLTIDKKNLFVRGCKYLNFIIS